MIVLEAGLLCSMGFPAVAPLVSLPRAVFCRFRPAGVPFLARPPSRHYESFPPEHRLPPTRAFVQFLERVLLNKGRLLLAPPSTKGIFRAPRRTFPESLSVFTRAHAVPVSFFSPCVTAFSPPKWRAPSSLLFFFGNKGPTLPLHASRGFFFSSLGPLFAIYPFFPQLISRHRMQLSRLFLFFESAATVPFGGTPPLHHSGRRPSLSQYFCSIAALFRYQDFLPHSIRRNPLRSLSMGPFEMCRVDRFFNGRQSSQRPKMTSSLGARFGSFFPPFDPN